MDEQSRRLRWRELIRKITPPEADGLIRLGMVFESLDDATFGEEKQLRAAMELGAAGQIDILETLFKKASDDTRP